MRIGIDFDGTLVSEERPYEDTDTPLVWLPGARDGVLSLHAAGHTLVLFTSRASPARLSGANIYCAILLEDFAPPSLSQGDIHVQRFLQCVDFILREVPDVFSAVTSDKNDLDLIIDNKALRFGRGPTAVDWREIAWAYGERVYAGATGRRA